MIDTDSFIQWCEERFDDVIVKGNEVRINSIFADDHGHHLWCNLQGGKHHREDGCYRCFYTDKIGTLIGLVMLVDGCDYEEAKEILSGHTPIGLLEKKLEEFFIEKEQIIKEKSNISLPKGSIPIKESRNEAARNYLTKRKLPIDPFYVCDSGDYKNRIVIPYYDANGKLIYFNSRNLKPTGLRYLGPDKSCGTGKADVVYAPCWANKGSKIYLTEGEFDAYTLFLCGYYGIACGGKSLSDNQVLFIKDYQVCLALDEDSAGLSGLKNMAIKLASYQISNITYVRPPNGIKDWNKMLQLFNCEVIKGYIIKHEKVFDDFTSLLI